MQRVVESMPAPRRCPLATSAWVSYGAQRQHDTRVQIEEALATYRRMSSVGRFIRRLGDKVANKAVATKAH